MAKLIFVNRYFYPDHSATSQMLSDLAFALAETGEFEVNIVTSRQRYDDPKAGLPAVETVNGVRVHRVWTSVFGRQNLMGRAFDYISFYVTAFAKLLVLADRRTVIIAKTDPPLISVMAALAARWRSAALVNWIQDLFPEVAVALGVRFVKGPVYPLLKWLRNLSLKAACMNVVIGELMKQRLTDEGIPEERIQVIHNWADGEQIRPIPQERNALRKAWGLDGKFVIGYSGNLGRGHDFSTILGAATALKNRDNIVFLFIGGGANLGWVENEVKASGLQNVVFKPYQPREKLAESLSAADVHLITLNPGLEGLIVPSKFYGIAAAGRAALFIGSPEGQVAQLIASADGGTTVVPGDVDQLVKSILALAMDGNLCAAQGQSSMRAFQALYSKSQGTALWNRLMAQMSRRFCGVESLSGVDVA